MAQIAKRMTKTRTIESAEKGAEHMVLSDTSFLSNCLMVAAERFTQNAAEFQNIVDLNMSPADEEKSFITTAAAKNMVEQFTTQADEARQLMSLIDNSASVVLAHVMPEEDEDLENEAPSFGR